MQSSPSATHGKKICIQTCLRPEVYEYVQHQAQAEGRTISNMVSTILLDQMISRNSERNNTLDRKSLLIAIEMRGGGADQTTWSDDLKWIYRLISDTDT